MKKIFGTHPACFATIILAVLIVCAHAGFLQAAPQGSDAGTVLKGFAPQTKISYTLQSAKGSIAHGEGVADKTGRFVIPSPGHMPYEALPISYRIQAEEPGTQDPLMVTLTMHPGDAGVSVKAQGLEQFGRVETRAITGTQRIRGDWAGILQKDKAAALKDIVAPHSFEVAFLDGQMNDAGAGASLPTIQVQVPTFGCPPVGLIAPISVCTDPQPELLTKGLTDNFTMPVKVMTQQLSAAAIQQMAILGKFFDAKMQLETQMLFQRMTAQAHKDYEPTEQMCEFGTFMRSLPKAEEKTGIQKAALNRSLMADVANRKDASTALGMEKDKETRLTQFFAYYCNPKDDDQLLTGICKTAQGAATKPERINRDISYIRLVGAPLTIDADFSADKTGPEEETEQDLLALGRNLYWPNAFNPSLDIEGQSKNFLERRRLLAMLNVAHNSYANIVGMKTKETPAANGRGSSDYMKALLKEFGLTDAEISQMIGDNPSYYAQMEVLAKKIYQSPDFYTNLYDKPANIDRIGVSLDAIRLMQNRDMYKSALRREMLSSMMVEAALTSKSSSSADTTGGKAGGAPAEAVNPAQ